MTVKRLLITAKPAYTSDPKVVPINADVPLEFISSLGRFQLQIFVKGFDGSQAHKSISKYDTTDSTYLDGSPTAPTETASDQPNLRILIRFIPSHTIKGSELIFGNEVTSSIKDHVPVSILSTGLKFFSWWVNPSIKGDLYADQPYLFGLAINSFTKIRIDDKEKFEDSSISPIADDRENLEFKNSDEQIPRSPQERQKFFSDISKASQFVFETNHSYTFQFDTNYVKIADSQYKLLIPTYGSRTLDIDVERFSDEKLNNFDWIIKQNGFDGVGEGETGLIVNFALVEEEK